jgi:PAS domain S-box-containing protein
MSSPQTVPSSAPAPEHHTGVPNRPRASWRRDSLSFQFTAALVATGFGVATRYLVDPLLGDSLPLICFTLPVLIAAFYVGPKSGLLVTALSLLAGWILFVPPRFAIAKGQPDQIFRAAMFGAAGVAISFLGSRVMLSQREAQRNEKRYTATFENTAVGMAHVALDGRWMRVNERMCNILGYTRAELSGLTFADLTHPDDLEADWAQARAVLAGEIASYSMEKRYRHKNGDVIWANLTVSLQRDEAGAPEYFISVVEDITARHEAQQKVRQNARLLDLTHEPIVARRLDGTIVFWNRGAELLYGWPREEAVGRNIGDLLRTGDPAPNVLPGHGTWVGELVHTTRDGKRIVVESRQALVREPAEAPFVMETNRDITGRKHAEQAVREAHQQFNAVITASPVPIVALTREGAITLWNPAAERVFGWTAPEVMGQPLPFIPEEKREEHRRMRARDLSGEGFTNLEITRRKKDGTLLDLSVSTAPLQDAAGTVIGIMSVYVDVTERHRMEHDLRESETKFRGLMEQSPMATLVISAAGRLLSVNKASERLFGVTADEFAGFDAFSNAQLAQLGVIPYLLRARAGEAVEVPEVEFVPDRGARRGQRVWVRTAAYPVRDERGAVREVVLVQEDVTERHLAQEALVRAQRELQESEQRLALAVRAHRIGIFDWDIQQGKVVWSEEQERVFGLAPGTFEGTIAAWSSRIHREDAARVMAEFAELWRQRRSTCSFSFRAIWPNGETRHVEGSGRFFYDDHGKALRMVGVNIDVTERKHAEDELRKVNSELEEFAYVASHDLQEPLRMINIYSQLLLRRSLGGDTAAAEFAAFIEQGVTRIDGLLRDLLSYSRVVHRDGLPPGRADLSAALAQARTVLDSRIAEANAEVYATPLPTVYGDANQLGLVFQNLLSNALKYRRAGVRPRIGVDCRLEGDHWLISVEDNGIGFEQKYAERIFGLFKRLFKDEYPGTGLGLAICQRIVERYGGRMWAEGRPGEGATFYFTLPKVDG